MLSIPPPVLVADHFPALLQELLDVLGSLGEEEWSLPTAASQWSVKDVALHLLGAEIGILSWRRDRFSEPHSAIHNWEQLVAWINQRNSVWVQAGRRMSPKLLIDLLRITSEQANAFLSTLDPLAPGGEVTWAASGPAPTWLEVAREFTERWHHQQHIRDAVSRPGCVDPYFLAPVLSAFVWALPRTSQNVDAGEGCCVTLSITGAAGGDWTVRREQGSWKLYFGLPERANAKVSVPEEITWRLFTQGITPEQARARATLSGDMNLAGKLLETISIIA